VKSGILFPFPASWSNTSSYLSAILVPHLRSFGFQSNGISSFSITVSQNATVSIFLASPEELRNKRHEEILFMSTCSDPFPHIALLNRRIDFRAKKYPTMDSLFSFVHFILACISFTNFMLYSRLLQRLNGKLKEMASSGPNGIVICVTLMASQSKLFLDVLLLAISGSCISVRNWRGDVRAIGSHQPRIGWFWIDFFGNFVVL
jgi:hypothetical protein